MKELAVTVSLLTDLLVSKKMYFLKGKTHIPQKNYDKFYIPKFTRKKWGLLLFALVGE